MSKWVIFYSIIFSLGWCLGYFWKVKDDATHRSWWNPSAWVSTILYEVASRAPNDLDMFIAAAYGVVEVCGIKRASKPAFMLLKSFINSKAGKKNAS